MGPPFYALELVWLIKGLGAAWLITLIQAILVLDRRWYMMRNKAGRYAMSIVRAMPRLWGWRVELRRWCGLRRYVGKRRSRKRCGMLRRETGVASVCQAVCLKQAGLGHFDVLLRKEWHLLWTVLFDSTPLHRRRAALICIVWESVFQFLRDWLW